MAKNYNVQTVSENINSGARAAEIGGLVAAGMTRYVTFIRVVPMAATNDRGSKVFFCSASISGAITCASATVTQKMVILIATASTVGNKAVAVPVSPDTEHPLFTIAAGSYLRALLSSAVTMTSSVQIFVQYYDE